MWYIHKP